MIELLHWFLKMENGGTKMTKKEIRSYCKNMLEAYKAILNTWVFEKGINDLIKILDKDIKKEDKQCKTN